LSNQILLEMKNITKRFPGVVALDSVNLVVNRGEVLTVVGENGAGKSTLIKIMSGAYQQDEGSIFFNGNNVGKMTPRKAIDLGIATIYQELSNVKGMSLAENIYLGVQHKKNGFIDYKKLYAESMDIQQKVGLEYLRPDTLLSNLSTAEQQLVEIGRAYSRNLNIIIMDEPTSALNNIETEKLFTLIRKIKAEGKAVIFISHKLDEVFNIGDRVQVLRNGESVYTSLIADAKREEIINSMCGRELTDMYPVSKRDIGDVIFEIKDLNTNYLKNISINVREKEIVGLYGLMGSGCSDIVECAFGSRAYKTGEFFIDGSKIEIQSPTDACGVGIAYTPADRKEQALLLTHPVKNNLTLVTLGQFIKWLFINLRKESEAAMEWVSRYNIKIKNLNEPAITVSGGNQQKIVLARWLASNPKIFLLNDPTKGIDVGAKVEIYKSIEELCNLGCGVVYVAAELPELLGIADRVYVIHEGAMAGEYTGDEITQKNIVASAIGEKNNENKN